MSSDIVERLRATESTAADFIGDPNPQYVTCWHRNPDGPEAATEIETLRAKLEEAYREGWQTGYRAGRVDGGSDSDWCDAEGDWEKSEARATLAKINQVSGEE